MKTPRLLEDVVRLVSQQTRLLEEITKQLPIYHQGFMENAMSLDEDDDDLFLDGSEPLSNEEIN